MSVGVIAARSPLGPIVALVFALACAGCAPPTAVSTGSAALPAPVTTPSTQDPTTAPTSAVAPSTTTAGPSPVYQTAANPIDAGGGLPRLPCSLPAWPNNDADLATFFTVAVGCLDRAWEPVLRRLGLPFTPARVVLTDGLPLPGDSVADPACGRAPEDNSYYCDDTIYLDQDSYLNTGTGPRGVPAAAIALVAHEYGHHIQRLSGLLADAVFRIDQAGVDTPAGLELSRRVETQAECFAGMFVGATFDPAGIKLAEQDAATRGDVPGRRPDHGDPTVFGSWFTTGATANTLTACDTWAATPAAVR